MSSRNSIILMIIISIILLLGLCYTRAGNFLNSHVDSRSKTINSLIVWGSEQGGLRSRIWTDKTVFSINEPILVYYAIQNVSKEPQTIWHSGFWPNHLINVTDSEGKAVKLTPLGDQNQRAFSPGGYREKNVPVVLTPKAVDSAWSEINLHEYFIFKNPGNYYVQYLYQENKSIQVKSNVLKVIIKK